MMNTIILIGVLLLASAAILKLVSFFLEKRIDQTSEK